MLNDKQLEDAVDQALNDDLMRDLMDAQEKLSYTKDLIDSKQADINKLERILESGQRKLAIMKKGQSANLKRRNILIRLIAELDIVDD